MALERPSTAVWPITSDIRDQKFRNLEAGLRKSAMPPDLPQRRARKFLNDHLQSHESFTRDEFKQATGWTKKTFETYWSKQFKSLVVELPDDRYRVSEGYRPFMAWKKFQRHVTQKRKVAADYTKTEYGNVIVYEFFMPLANEAALRTTLDALFFKDNVIPKLRAIGIQSLEGKIPRDAGEGEDAYLDRLCSWVGEHFGGYSIYHVDGRFLSGKILSRDEVAAQEKAGQRYLIDETTAVTRFIFPCTSNNEAELVRFFFNELFAETIIQLVNAEDQIWMVESGMRNRVHVWRVQDEDDDGGFDEADVAGVEDEDPDGEPESDAPGDLPL